MSNKSKSESFWDKSAGNYDKTEERFEHIHEKSREYALTYLKEGDIVLDYGCGTGTTSCEFASKVKEIHAIDISSKMIEIAKEKTDSAKVENISFVQTEIFDERYKRESFDAVLAFNMLHTVPNPQSAVLRIHELLKPEGLLISVTPCLGEKMSLFVRMQILFVQLLCKVGVIPIAIRRVRSFELDEFMKSASFQIIDTKKIFKGASSYFLVAKK